MRKLLLLLLLLLLPMGTVSLSAPLNDIPAVTRAAVTQQARDRVVLALRRTDPFPNWRRAHRAPAATRITLHLALKQRNLQQLERRFWDVTNHEHQSYQQYMTAAEIDALVATPLQDVQRVVNWLTSSHNRTATVGGGGHRGGGGHIKRHADAITYISTVADVEHLFHTSMYVYEHATIPRRVHVAAHGAYSIPRHLADVIELVTGIFEFPVPHFRIHRVGIAPPQQRAPAKRALLQAHNVAGAASSTTTKEIEPVAEPLMVVIPQTAGVMYQLNTAKPVSSSAASQGVIEFDFQSMNPGQLKNFSVVLDLGARDFVVDPKRIIGPNFADWPGVESTLDIEYLMGIGMNITSWFWLNDDGMWLYDWALAFHEATDVPNVVSISYGWDEAEQCFPAFDECLYLGVNSVQYVRRTNTEFQKIGLRGVSILVAAGDSGANGRADEWCLSKQLTPSFPASSPFVTAIGATQCVNSVALKAGPKICSGSQYRCIGQCAEEAVSYSQAHFASGGGFSNVALMPDYQRKHVEAYLNSGVPLPPAGYFNASGRAYPDMAAFGSHVLIQSLWLEPVGGTSAATPIVAGFMALLVNEHMKKFGKPLGFLNPLLYRMASEHPAAFHDITVGNNRCTESGCSKSCQGFECTKGWDPVSGLGSPMYAEMLKFILDK